MGVLYENHVGINVLRNVFYQLTYNKISVHVVYVGLFFKSALVNYSNCPFQ